METNGSCEEVSNPKDIAQDIVNQINEELRVVDNAEDIYKGLGTTGFVKSALDKVVKEQCQKISKEINEAQTFTMCKMENIQLKKKIENLHIALKKKVEKNKLQASEITLLLKQKKELMEENVQLETTSNINNVFRLSGEIDKLNTIIKYLEGRLNEK